MQKSDNLKEAPEYQVADPTGYPSDHPMDYNGEENKESQEILKSPPQHLNQAHQSVKNLANIARSDAMIPDIENDFGANQILSDEKWDLKTQNAVNNQNDDIVPLIGSPDKANHLQMVIEGEEKSIVVSPEILSSPNPQTLSISQRVSAVTNSNNVQEPTVQEKEVQDQTMQNDFLPETCNVQEGNIPGNSATDIVDRKEAELRRAKNAHSDDVIESEELVDFQRNTSKNGSDQQDDEQNLVPVNNHNHLHHPPTAARDNNTWMDESVEQYRESENYDLNEVVRVDVDHPNQQQDSSSKQQAFNNASDDIGADQNGKTDGDVGLGSSNNNARDELCYLELNDRRFYTLEELEELEPQFDKKFNLSGSGQGGASGGNQHMLLSPQEHRAKLYWLDQENKWKDIGTGRFRILLSKNGEEHYIQIVSEEGMEDARSSPNANESLDADGRHLLDNPADSGDLFLDSTPPSVVPPASNNESPKDTPFTNEGADEEEQEVIPMEESNETKSFANEAEVEQQASSNLPLNPNSSSKRQQILHRSFIASLSEFSRQGSTIITWQDEYKNEFALSFQEEKGASDTWWSICFLKGIQINSIDEQKSDRESSQDQGGAHVDEQQLDEVSMPTKDNLQMVVTELSTNDQYARRTIAETILKRQDRNNQTVIESILDSQSERDHTKLSTWRSTYLDKLLKIFTEVEENYFRAEKAMEQNEGDEHYRQICMTQQIGNLHSLFQIYRNMLSLNQSDLIEVLLNTHYWETTFGALEYDPEIFFPIVRSNGFESGGDPNSPSQISYSSMSNFSGSPRSNSRTFGSGSQFGEPNVASISAELGDGGNQDTTSPTTRNLLRESLQSGKNGKEENQKSGDGMSDAESCNFRHFLKNQVKFREAVTIKDPQVLYFIHLSYKLQFLKDTAMARFIDEHTSRIILQLITSMHQYIVDYIFGEEFDRIQTELLSKMQDRANCANKEIALKFQLEICSLIKSLNLPNRQFQACNNAFAKLIHVMSQIFNIMIPNRKTLLAEVVQDTNTLIKEFEAIEEEKIAKDDEEMEQKSQQETPRKYQNETKNESEQKDLSLNNEQEANEMNEDAFQHVNIWKFNPGRDTIIEYLKKPYAKSDPSITQIDALKSNSIEVFNNLLVMNNSVVSDFVSNEVQSANNHIFLQHLAYHMIYSDQLGIKVGICEFFKDLIQRESPCDMQKKLQKIILMNILSIFLDFLQTDDFELRPKQQNDDFSDQDSKNKENLNNDLSLVPDLNQIRQQDKKLFKRSLDQSRVLTLQLLESLVTDNGEMTFEQKRVFIQNAVMQKVVECKRFESIQTNVEIIKFFKAIIASKDSKLIHWMISRDIFEQIVNIFLENKNKGNLLHSAILNLFEMLTPSEQQIQGMGSAAPHLNLNSHLSNSWAPGGTSGGFVQIDLLNKLYKKLIESGLAQKVFFCESYENDFKKFNRFLRNMIETMNSGFNSSSKERDRSDSMARKLQESGERSQTSANNCMNTTEQRISSPYANHSNVNSSSSSQQLSQQSSMQSHLRGSVSSFNSGHLQEASAGAAKGVSAGSSGNKMDRGRDSESPDIVDDDNMVNECEQRQEHGGNVARSLNFKESEEDLEDELEQIAFGWGSKSNNLGQQVNNNSPGQQKQPANLQINDDSRDAKGLVDSRGACDQETQQFMKQSQNAADKIQNSRIQAFLKEGDPSILTESQRQNSSPSQKALQLEKTLLEKDKIGYLSKSDPSVSLTSIQADASERERQSEDKIDDLPSSPLFKDRNSSPEDTLKIPFNKLGPSVSNLAQIKSPSQLQADSLGSNDPHHQHITRPFRPRRLSHDDMKEPQSSAGNAGGDQSGGGRNGNSSKPGSIFSESSSNPDLDEIYFNKGTTTGGQVGVNTSSAVEFSIGNQQSVPRINQLLAMDRQGSSGQHLQQQTGYVLPSAGLLRFSPSQSQGKQGLSKPRSSRSKSTGQRYERKSRALSEDPCRNLKRDQAPLQQASAIDKDISPNEEAQATREDITQLYATKWSPDGQKTSLIKGKSAPDLPEQAPYKEEDSLKKLDSNSQNGNQLDKLHEQKTSTEALQIGVKRSRKQFEEEKVYEMREGDKIDDSSQQKRHKSEDQVDPDNNKDSFIVDQAPNTTNNNPNEQIRPK